MNRKSGPGARKDSFRERRLYTLDVYIISGPVTEKFAKKNRVICRRILIRSDQTLQELHRAIFDAFDREEEHMYEFQVGGKGPRDSKARRYVLPSVMKDPFGEGKPDGSVTSTAVGSLGLKPGQPFGYWFDFGDDWWHQINVAGIDDRVRPGKYPKVTKRVGASPPQYANLNAEDEG